MVLQSSDLEMSHWAASLDTHRYTCKPSLLALLPRSPFPSSLSGWWSLCMVSSCDELTLSLMRPCPRSTDEACCVLQTLVAMSFLLGQLQDPLTHLHTQRPVTHRGTLSRCTEAQRCPRVAGCKGGQELLQQNKSILITLLLRSPQVPQITPSKEVLPENPEGEWLARVVRDGPPTGRPSEKELHSSKLRKTTTEGLDTWTPQLWS